MGKQGSHQPRNGEICTMRTQRSLHAILVICCILAVPAAAPADEPVVRRQLYSLEGRFEVMLAPVFSAFDKYTRHIGASGGVAYYFTDWLGLEVEGGYAFLSDDRKLLNEILRTAETIEGIERLPLDDLKRMTWWATGGLVFSPLYGKLNLSAELAVSIHLYLVGGAGVAQYHYSKLDHTEQDPAFDSRFGKVDTDYGMKPSFYFGGGLRFHFAEHWSVRFEIRDVFFHDEYEAQHKPAGVDVEDKTITDFVHTVFLRLGVCYAF